MEQNDSHFLIYNFCCWKIVWYVGRDSDLSINYSIERVSEWLSEWMSECAWLIWVSEELEWVSE